MSNTLIVPARLEKAAKELVNNMKITIEDNGKVYESTDVAKSECKNCALYKARGYLCGRINCTNNMLFREVPRAGRGEK